MNNGYSCKGYILVKGYSFIFMGGLSKRRGFLDL